MKHAYMALAWLVFKSPVAAQAPPERTLVVSGEVTAPAEEVYRAFTTAEGIVKAWGVAQARVDFRAGGEIRTSYKPETDLSSAKAIVNRILAYEPGRMLAVKPLAPEGAPDWLQAICESGFNVIRLEPIAAERCRVIVTGMGFREGPLFDKAYEFFQRGNETTIEHMKQAFGKATEPRAEGASSAAESLEPVRHVAVVKGTPGEVFRLLSTGEGWREFFGASSKIELRPGGAFELYFSRAAPERSRGSETCTVLSYVPGEMLSFTWNAPPKFAHARARHTWVVVRLEPAGPGETRILLDHLGFADQAAANPDHAGEWREVRGYFQSAWGKVLGAISQHTGK